MKTFNLIPRVRVNYSWGDILKSLIVSSRKNGYLIELEMLICKYFNKQNTLLTSSGRSSLYYILCHLKQKKVVVPSYTCSVVTEAALLAKKDIVYVDVDLQSFNTCRAHLIGVLDDDSIFIATHQYGLVCDIESIVEYCHSCGCVVIEDCAAALGSKFQGKLVGTFGDYAFFSFDSSKLISIPPKGGFILAKEDNEVLRIKKEYKNKVVKCSYKYKIKNICKGIVYLLLSNRYLYRIFHFFMLESRGVWQLASNKSCEVKKSDYYSHDLYNWQALIAVKQFKQIDKYVADRQKKYAFYDKYITNEKVVKPQVDMDSCLIRYAVLVDDKDAFYKELTRNGVDCAFSFSHCVCPSSFKTAHIIAESVLDLPFYYRLSEKELWRVVNVINNLNK